MISMRRISLGGGYRYLMESVARGDGAPDPTAGLTAYYAASGTPPGRFLGSGPGRFGRRQRDQRGHRGDRGTPAQHARRLLRPDHRPAGGASPQRRRQGGAGSRLRPDLLLHRSRYRRRGRSPIEPTKAVIYDCHLRAVRYVLAYAEREVFHSRSGTNGIVEEDIAGLVAAAFTHWDSRAGDPQLHDHVVVWNRAQSVSDGKWRTLDSRGLYKARSALVGPAPGRPVRLSHRGPGRRLGRPGPAPLRPSPAGRSPACQKQLIREFSQRAEAVEREADRLIAEFGSAHGRSPTGVETIKLRQQATLATRPDKTHRSLAEMTDDWRQRAGSHIDGDPVAWVASLRDRNDLPLLHAADLAEPILADAASAVVASVAERRATFSRANLLDEAHRILHGVRFADPDERSPSRSASPISPSTSRCSSPRRPCITPRPAISARTARRDCTPRATTSTPPRSLLDAEARLLDAGRTPGAADDRRGHRRRRR